MLKAIFMNYVTVQVYRFDGILVYVCVCGDD